MTTIAATPIYGKNFMKNSPEPEGWWPWDLVCNIGDVGPTKFVQMMILGIVIYLMSRSNLLLNAFKWEKVWKEDFLETVEA